MADRHAPEKADARSSRDHAMTEEQREYLHTLSDEAGEPFRDDLTQEQAIEMIDRLQIKTGRSRD